MGKNSITLLIYHRLESLKLTLKLWLRGLRYWEIIEIMDRRDSEMFNQLCIRIFSVHLLRSPKPCSLQNLVF
jgi:hypothetical protein